MRARRRGRGRFDLEDELELVRVKRAPHGLLHRHGPVLHQLRAHDPVHWSSMSCWWITRYSDVTAGLRVQGTAQVPVLMLTARGDAMDRVVGLELGADDYLPKPFEPRELLARLRAILRRTNSSNGGGHADRDVLRFGELTIDRAAHRVTKGGDECALTGHQFSLLLALTENAGRVLSREQLMRLTKGEELEAFDRSIDVHISRIRSLIEDDPKQPRHLLTLRGVGYLFAAQRDG